MKKRPFLAPLAISIAALLGSTPTIVSATVPTDGIEGSVPTSSTKTAAPISDFVLQRGGANRLMFADHESHYSHESHASHSSHFSGY